jgi:hypothetical protein
MTVITNRPFVPLYLNGEYLVWVIHFHWYTCINDNKFEKRENY